MYGQKHGYKLKHKILSINISQLFKLIRVNGIWWTRTQAVSNNMVCVCVPLTFISQAFVCLHAGDQ